MAKKQVNSLSGVDLLLRFLAPLALVLITYNPTGYSLYTWISNAIAAGEMGGIHFLALVLIVIGWSILLVATWRSLDTFGVILTCALLAAIVWVLIDWGLLNVDSASAITWIVLFCLAGVLAVGLSWAHLWRRMTGQYTVDEADD
jgi:membrane protein CcdC involved in cytochrome C biogenesis